MPTSQNIHAAGERVETLLSELRGLAAPATVVKAEELVRALVELYGAGLERVLRIVVDMEAAELLHRLATDRLVSGLLILHDLHPLDTGERVRGALEEVSRRLGLTEGEVEPVAITADGTVRLRLRASSGCRSSLTAVRQAIERAVAEAAPEVAHVDLEVTADRSPTLLQIRPGPPGSSPAAPGPIS
jgi:Fe-S cluster biogenesis protein NfuA